MYVLPQQVYLPLDTLAAAAIYPALPDTLSRDAIDVLLHKVGLGHRLDRETNATNGLSVGEQQRLALARVLAAKPDWVFLDEATSALDIELERMLMTLLRTELPDATLVVVAHREPQGLTDVTSRSVAAGRQRQIAEAGCTLTVADRNTVARTAFPSINAGPAPRLLLEARLAGLSGVGLELQRDGSTGRNGLLRFAL